MRSTASIDDLYRKQGSPSPGTSAYPLHAVAKYLHPVVRSRKAARVSLAVSTLHRHWWLTLTHDRHSQMELLDLSYLTVAEKNRVLAVIDADQELRVKRRG